jgi:hypothetical protein
MGSKEVICHLATSVVAGEEPHLAGSVSGLPSLLKTFTLVPADATFIRAKKGLVAGQEFRRLTQARVKRRSQVCLELYQDRQSARMRRRPGLPRAGNLVEMRPANELARLAPGELISRPKQSFPFARSISAASASLKKATPALLPRGLRQGATVRRKRAFVARRRGLALTTYAVSSICVF